MNFLEHSILHVSHSLVVRILASGAGGPGSNPGGVTCGIGEEGLGGNCGSCMVSQKCVVKIEFL
jgi:hypothetical protein